MLCSLLRRAVVLQMSGYPQALVAALPPHFWLNSEARTVGEVFVVFELCSCIRWRI